MPRRTNGEGTIYFNPKRNEYVGCLKAGVKSDGTPNRIFFYSGKGGKKGDVTKKMNDWRLRHEADFADASGPDRPRGKRQNRGGNV